MFFIASTFFPVIAITAGVVALVASVRFVAKIYHDITTQNHNNGH